jgi:hypothetical protein
VDSVNKVCAAAGQSCDRVSYPYYNAQRNPYDIRDELPVSFPSDAYLEYLNTDTVQKSLGVPVNFTSANNAVYRAFNNSMLPMYSPRLLC